MPSQAQRAMIERGQGKGNKNYHYAWEIFKKLQHEKINMFGGQRRKDFSPARANEASSEADNLGIKGWLKDLYLLERTSGTIPASSVASPDMSFIEQFSGGVLRGGTETYKYNPIKKHVEIERREGSAEQAEKGFEKPKPLNWLGDLLGEQGIRLLEILGGGALVLFGLYVLVKGETPSIGKAVKHAL